jgi:hypothetical protein
MTGTRAIWARGAWVHSLTNEYKAGLVPLRCPKATSRRGPGDYEHCVSADDPSAVDWGGPTTAYDFPMSDPADSAHLLTASCGLNCWVYNPDTKNIQGRVRQKPHPQAETQEARQPGPFHRLNVTVQRRNRRPPGGQSNRAAPTYGSVNRWRGWKSQVPRHVRPLAPPRRLGLSASTSSSATSGLP